MTLTDAVMIFPTATDRLLAEARLAACQRLASLGTIAAGVVHEFDNPLTSLLGNLEFAASRVEELAQRLPIETQLQDALVDAREAAEQLRRIARDLKLSSRPSEEADRGPADVQSALESAVRMAAYEIRSRARLITSYERTPPVFASESRIRQVFLNLLLNAAQAIPGGSAETNEVRVTSRVDPGGRVAVTVADTGCGIPPEVQRRLFTPFFTTKPAGVGTGLGLSICQRIVASCDGTMSFTSQVGKGTEFCVVLPAARHEAAA